jgi:hypothetical protein
VSEHKYVIADPEASGAAIPWGVNNILSIARSVFFYDAEMIL